MCADNPPGVQDMFCCFWPKDCTMGSDCDDGMSCTTDNCVNGLCDYQIIPGCNEDPIVGSALVTSGCGDGTKNEAAGEVCDDGNKNDCDGCNSDCTLSVNAPAPGHDRECFDAAGGRAHEVMDFCSGKWTRNEDGKCECSQWDQRQCNATDTPTGLLQSSIIKFFQ